MRFTDRRAHAEEAFLWRGPGTYDPLVGAPTVFLDVGGPHQPTRGGVVYPRSLDPGLTCDLRCGGFSGCGTHMGTIHHPAIGNHDLL